MTISTGSGRSSGRYRLFAKGLILGGWLATTSTGFGQAPIGQPIPAKWESAAPAAFPSPRDYPAQNSGIVLPSAFPVPVNPNAVAPVVAGSPNTSRSITASAMTVSPTPAPIEPQRASPIVSPEPIGMALPAAYPIAPPAVLPSPAVIASSESPYRQAGAISPDTPASLPIPAIPGIPVPTAPALLPVPSSPTESAPAPTFVVPPVHTASSPTSSIPAPTVPAPVLTGSTDWLTGPTTMAAVVQKPPTAYPSARFTGFFHLDSIYTTQTRANQAVVGRAEDGLDFRRARLGVTGNLADDISYRMEFDFAASQPLFVDMWVQFAKVASLGNIRIGRFRQPFGMDALTSVRDLAFLERPSMFTFAPFRQTGIMAFDTMLDDLATYAVSGYRYNTDPFGNVLDSSGGYGFATRLTALPFYQGDHNLVHVGGSYSYNTPGGANGDILRFANTPELFAGDVTGGGLSPSAVNLPNFVDTGRIAVQSTNLFNLEAAFLRNNFAMQGEARWAVINQLDCGRVMLPSYYTRARYLLTGEQFTYDKKNATIGGVKPDRPVSQGGMGAWEIAGQYSYINLNGTMGVLGSAPHLVPGPGRILQNLTLGLNWYLIDNAKLQFDYIHAFLDDPIQGTSDADFFALRCQVDF